MPERRFIADVELRVGDEGKYIEGYTARFNSWSEDLGGFREIIRPGAFKKTLKEADVRCLANHDPNMVLGRNRAKTLELSEDKKGLWFQAELPDTTYARDLKVSMERGDVNQCSFGFQTVKDTWSDNFSQRELVEVKLFDVGPVTFPAYPDTEAQIRSLLEVRSEAIRSACEDFDLDMNALLDAIFAIREGETDLTEHRVTVQKAIEYLSHIVAPNEPDEEVHSAGAEEPRKITPTRMRTMLVDIKNYMGGK